MGEGEGGLHLIPNREKEVQSDLLAKSRPREDTRRLPPISSRFASVTHVAEVSDEELRYYIPPPLSRDRVIPVMIEKSRPPATCGFGTLVERPASVAPTIIMYCNMILCSTLSHEYDRVLSSRRARKISILRVTWYYNEIGRIITNLPLNIVETTVP